MPVVYLLIAFLQPFFWLSAVLTEASIYGPARRVP